MDLSVIIPVYNSGAYLPDALESAERAINYCGCSSEIILIDDGSTDPDTTKLLSQLPDRGHTVLTQSNRGPAAARNRGIKAAKGKYLLFLDSDNMIKAHFVETAINIFETQSVDLVHGKADFFGESDCPRFNSAPFDFYRILMGNYIDVCCIIYRDVCIDIGGFDEEKCLIGFEDWEFYIRAHLKGHKFHYINDSVYDYRILSNSLSQSHDFEGLHKAYSYVYSKYAWQVMHSLAWAHSQYQSYLLDRQRPFRSCLKYLYYKFIKKEKQLAAFPQ
jgi:glycosyltransferase involved in cell wall biosynthesis